MIIKPIKPINPSSKDSKIKLSLADFELDKIENSSSVVGGQGKCDTASNCTDGDDGCCNDMEIDDDRICVNF